METRPPILVHRITLARVSAADGSKSYIAMCRYCRKVIERSPQPLTIKDSGLIAVHDAGTDHPGYELLADVLDPLPAGMKMCCQKPAYR